MSEEQNKSGQVSQNQHQLNEGLKTNSGKSAPSAGQVYEKNNQAPRGARPPRNEK